VQGNGSFDGLQALKQCHNEIWAFILSIPQLHRCPNKVEESINKLKKILRVYLIESVALSRRRTSLASKMP
jgi:hypothetical protein